MSRLGGVTVPSRWSPMRYVSPDKGCTTMLMVTMMVAEACALGASPNPALIKGVT